MEQIEINSWKALDALKEAATRQIFQLNDPGTDEISFLFIEIADDYLELQYNQFDISYIRHYPDEESCMFAVNERKAQLNFEDYQLDEQLVESLNADEPDSTDDLDDFSIKGESL